MKRSREEIIEEAKNNGYLKDKSYESLYELVKEKNNKELEEAKKSFEKAFSKYNKLRTS